MDGKKIRLLFTFYCQQITEDYKLVNDKDWVVLQIIQHVWNLAF